MVKESALLDETLEQILLFLVNTHLYFHYMGKGACSFVEHWHTQWRRQWHPTPVLLPGKSHGWRSLVGCLLWGRTELDTTEAT